MITKVISGGQSGCDQAGWRAARRFGLPCGGFMPKGFLTEDGPRPEFAELYGAVEHASAAYPPRTRANVESAFVLVWFGNPRSPGGRLTLGHAEKIGVAFRYTVEHERSEWTAAVIARHVANAFEQQKHFPGEGPDRTGVLLIAGNRESSNPGIGEWVERYLCEVFRAMGMEEKL